MPPKRKSIAFNFQLPQGPQQSMGKEKATEVIKSGGPLTLDVEDSGA